MRFVQSVLGVLLASTFVLTGCNTAKGFGEDMQQGGEAIQKAAHDATTNSSTPSHS